MEHKGPYLTLLSGVVLAAVLLVADSRTTPDPAGVPPYGAGTPRVAVVAGSVPSFVAASPATAPEVRGAQLVAAGSGS